MRMREIGDLRHCDIANVQIGSCEKPFQYQIHANVRKHLSRMYESFKFAKPLLFKVGDWPLLAKVRFS